MDIYEYRKKINPCYGCGFFDLDYESCTCDSSDLWVACPIKSMPDEWFGNQSTANASDKHPFFK